MTKVCVFIPTADEVEPAALEAIAGQTYRDVTLVVTPHPPEHEHEHPIVRLYLNTSSNRNRSRAEALATDADLFLSLDSDIVLPPNGVEELVKQMRPDNRVVGGWYKMIHSHRWVCGHWVADNVFVNYRQPVASLSKAHMVGLGCAMMTRKVLETIKFEDGTHLVCKNEQGKPIIVGECGIFGNRCAEHGFPMYVNGDVVCQHLRRRRNSPAAA